MSVCLFQVVIDSLFFDIHLYFLDENYLVWLQKWSKEFKDRKHFWRGFSDEKLDLPPLLRTIEVLCYSSQYYFVNYYGTSGHLFAIFGLMAIIESGVYPWEDSLIFIILVINQILILIFEWLTLKARGWLKIWDIETPKETKDSAQEGSDSDLNNYMVLKNTDE